MKKSLLNFFLFLLISVLVISCKKKNEDDVVDFDKGAMLTNMADNNIIPAYTEFYNQIVELETAYSQFELDRSSINLELVRDRWKSAYLSWQAVKMFEFGPAMTIGLKGAIGTFPSDTAQIEANVSSGIYDLASLMNVDAIGLSSLDYLLYQQNALADFNSGNNYITYGNDVIQKMKNEALYVKNSWSTYRSTFISSTGNESTSAFSMMVNDYCQDYEEAKTAKLGIPIGKQSLGIQMPEYIEARFSGFSFPILRKSISSLSDVYLGNSLSGASGIGFDDYLIALDKSTLNTTIQTRFSNILTKIDAFGGTLESEMSSNATGLEELYQLIAGQVVYLKTDMTSSFGILITYQDNDGD